MRQLLILLAVASAACVSTASSIPAWEQFTAFNTPDKLGGCVVADLDHRYPGDEIGVVSSSGKVYVVRRDPELGTFAREIVAELPGEMIQCAAGDLDGRPGTELYTVGIATGGEDDGGPGAAWRIRLGAEGWEADRIFEDEALLHAVAIGDLDPGHVGDELVLAGYTKRVHLLVPSGNVFASQRITELPGEAKGAAIGPDKDGLPALIVVCANGSAVRVRQEDDTWMRETIGLFDTALARVAVSADGNVLIAGNDGNLRHIVAGETEYIECSADRQRGAVFADVDPLREGVELATAGYDGRILVISRKVVDGEIRYHITGAASDSDKFHHLAAGELPGLGAVLVACGYSGRVIVVDKVEP